PLPVETAHDAHWQSVVDTINELRPHIQAEGGDMTLLNVTPRQVTVSLSGSCSGCMMTDMTLAWLQQKLMERTGTYMDVVAAPAAVN
ncbi:NifU family protein, partial [Klebsiella pneumoniae]|uniref:NifU family protein n=1 Tax=Klebsiella pneumoniae TaxID=573 RepID=UPI003B5B1A1F